MDVQYKRYKQRQDDDSTWLIIDSQDFVIKSYLITIEDTQSTCDVFIKNTSGEDISDNFEDTMRAFDRMNNYLDNLPDHINKDEWGDLAAERMEALCDISDGKMTHSDFLKKIKHKKCGSIRELFKIREQLLLRNNRSLPLITLFVNFCTLLSNKTS